MPRAPTEIRSIARKWTFEAIDTLVEIMQDKEAAPSARQSAASALLDRGWGKAMQPIEADVTHNYVARMPAGVKTADEWQQTYHPTTH